MIMRGQKTSCTIATKAFVVRIAQNTKFWCCKQIKLIWIHHCKRCIYGGRYVNTVNAKDNSAVFENASFETLHYVKAYKRFDVYSMDDETLQSEYKYFDRITVDGETKPLRVKSTDNRSASANTSLAVVDSKHFCLNIAKINFISCIITIIVICINVIHYCRC